MIHDDNILQTDNILEDDYILVQKVLEGKTDVFRILLEKYQKTIFYLGLKFFHNYVDAEDFAQEVFLKVFENLGFFKGRESPEGRKSAPGDKSRIGEGPGSFKGWLYKLAFNLAVNKYHLNKRKFLLTGEIKETHMEEDIISDTAESVENELIKKEAVREINTICKELPGVYNIVIKMHYYDGLKLKEIQDILDVPLNTVKSYIFRAKGLIKKKLLAKKQHT